MITRKTGHVLISVVLIVCFNGSPRATTQKSAPQNQQRAHATLDQMIAALGGPAYLNAQDSESEGRSGRFDHGSSQGSTVFHRIWRWPDKERVELTKQRDIAEVIVGDDMYEITFRGTRLIDPEKDYDARVRLERRRHALEIVIRQWLNAPGTAIFDEGTALAENRPVERITIINPRNDAVTLSIDQETHLPVKKTFVIRDPQGSRDEIGEVYDNWKTIQAINTPYNTLVMRNGDLYQQVFLSSVAYNVHLQDSLFRSPVQR